MFARMGLGPKIYLVVILLALVAASISYVGIDAMRTYNRRVHQMQHYTHATVVGEEVNGLILSVVMDSRGVYMARDHAEAEKYAPLILKNLATMKQKMAEWTDYAEKEDTDKMDRAKVAASARVRTTREMSVPSTSTCHGARQTMPWSPVSCAEPASRSASRARIASV